ncbi:MAG: nucleotidyltransferase domain-containing protein [Chloroflexi bacterium]|nr:nucleotidyltransferase domain-containing protein [Chloroflexota bacterium]
MRRDDVLAILRDFKRDYADEYGITEVGVFGSVARDESRDDSDVDICIKTRTPDPLVLVHIKESIERLLHNHVDTVRVREKMNPFLKERIDQEAYYV